MSQSKLTSAFFDFRFYEPGSTFPNQSGQIVQRYHCLDIDALSNYPKTVVVKLLPNRTNIDAAKLNDLMAHDHPNIVKVLDIFWNRRFRYADQPFKALVFEYCEGGDINAQVHITKSQLLEWTFDIADGLNFLHENDVVHGDVKPRNIFLKSNGKCQVAKLGDFDDAFTGNRGRKTNDFAAPDRDPIPTPACDVYSFALTVKELWKKVYDKGDGDIDDFLSSYGNANKSSRPSMSTFLKAKNSFENNVNDNV